MNKKPMEIVKENKLNDILKVTYVSDHSFDKAKKHFKNHNNYVNYLIEAGVNPYLIPYNLGIPYIKNPFKFFDKSLDAYRIFEEEWNGLAKETDYLLEVN